MDPAIPPGCRRSMVLNMLGGRHGDAPGEEGGAGGDGVRAHPPRQAMADVDNTRSTTTVEQVQEWCTPAPRSRSAR